MEDQDKGAIEKPVPKKVAAEKPAMPEVKKDQWKRHSDKVAIVGCSDSKDDAPFDNESWELWGVNNLFFHIKRWTRWFEIHNIQFDGQKWLRRGSPDFRGQTVNDYVAGLAGMKTPVYMQKKWPQIPNSAAYPVKKIIDHFGDYFTNTISWMIALAIWMGYKEIGVWGVDMAVDCLGADTKVLTADLRWVRCDEIEVGNELVGFDEYPKPIQGKDREWKKTIVTEALRVTKPCYRVHFEDGTAIVASAKHGWLTHNEGRNNWKTTDELVTIHHRKDRPTRVLKAFDIWKAENSRDVGYLAGAFDADGHLGQTPRKEMPSINHMSLGFAQNENEMWRLVINLLEKYKFKYSINSIANSNTKQVNLNGGKSEIMKFLGQFRPIRLLERYKVNAMGGIRIKNRIAVTKTEYLGEQPTIGLKTDAKTFITEGFLNHNSEYFWQRPSCEFFLGWAKGAGIKMHVCPTSDLLKIRYLYGFQEPEMDNWRKKMVEIKQSMGRRANDAKAKMDVEQQKFWQYQGAIQAAREIDKIWK